MYDVVHVAGQGRKTVVADGLRRGDACALARAEARRLGVGRMFLAGSEPSPKTDVILIVESRRQVA